MIKVVFLSLSFISLSSSFAGKDQDLSQKQAKYNWGVEYKKLKQESKKVAALFKWYEITLKNHAREIYKHSKEIKRTIEESQKLKKSGKNLLLKKIKLEFMRSQSKMENEHTHFLEDLKKLQEVVRQFEKLKSELGSHEGHHHH